MDTYSSALARIGVTVPPHLDAQAQVPVLTGVQAQGDLLIVPERQPAAPDREPDREPVRKAGREPVWKPVDPAGVQVVRGEATGNTHWLHAGFDSTGVRWAWSDVDLICGWLDVPAGQTAMLIHTDEHGANGIGPGRYAIHRKRELDLAAPERPRIVHD